jgi:hypothetical protein
MQPQEAGGGRGDPARVAHVLPHRVRLRARALVGRREACSRVARALAEGMPCDRVSARPLTGSVVIERADGTVDAEAVARALTALVAAERDPDGRPITEQPAAKPHRGPTLIAHAMAHAMAEINGDLRDALDGHADLGTLLPVAFGLAGVAEVASTRKLPVPQWFQLLWWSLRSFMTFNRTAMREEMLDPSMDDEVGARDDGEGEDEVDDGE